MKSVSVFLPVNSTEAMGIFMNEKLVFGDERHIRAKLILEQSNQFTLELIENFLRAKYANPSTTE